MDFGAVLRTVSAFLEGLIPWRSIAEVISETLDAHDLVQPDSVEAVLEADRSSREQAGKAVQRRMVAA